MRVDMCISHMNNPCTEDMNMNMNTNAPDSQILDAMKRTGRDLMVMSHDLCDLHQATVRMHMLWPDEFQCDVDIPTIQHMLHKLSLAYCEFIDKYDPAPGELLTLLRAMVNDFETKLSEHLT